MKKLMTLAVTAITALALRPAMADPAAPVAVELFTSQGCYSCPPAEAYLGELAKRKDVVALEWHVDYWDKLVCGSAGQWKDPFSSPAATRRQYAYNNQITGRARAYTPQMIVGGQKESVGSERSKVENAIRRLRKAGPGVALDVQSGASGEIIVNASGATATLWRVEFQKLHVTEVLRGENKGKRLESHNIVQSKSRVGQADGRPIEILTPQPGNGCAILAQVGEVGPVLAAAYCPGDGPAA
jgi:hypothetical protein